MSGIICAIRGGAASEPTIEQAILVAKKTKLPLHFLYVVNVDFLKSAMHTRIKTISNELREMGEFILLTAQAKARERSVMAETTVRSGDVTEEISTFAREVGADYIVLGRPVRSVERNVLAHDLLHELVHAMQEETGAKVLFSAGELE